MALRDYNDMKKNELIELCRLHGIEVHSRDTKADLIAKLSNRKTEAEDVPAKEAPASNRRRREAGRKREQAARKKDRREQTEDIMDNYTMKPIEGLAPKVIKKPAPVQKRNEALERIDRELAASMVDPYHTLKGTVLGPNSSETRIVGGRKIQFVNYNVEYGPYTILIPSFMFWYDWQDEEAHPSNRLYEHGTAMSGAEIEFNMFKKLPGATTEIYGTRLYASKIRRCETWYTTLTDGSWAVDEGSIVEAQIMRVRPYNIIVEVGGAETSIPIGEVSHFYLNTVNPKRDEKNYWPGKKVMVRVSDIEREEVPSNPIRFDYPVRFKASIKAAQENPQITHFDDYEEGATLPAVITNIHAYQDEAHAGKMLYYCNVRNQIVVAADLGPGVGKSYVPEIGSRVKVRIKEKDRSRHSFYGVIINVEPTMKDNEEFMVLDI